MSAYLSWDQVPSSKSTSNKRPPPPPTRRTCAHTGKRFFQKIKKKKKLHSKTPEPHAKIATYIEERFVWEAVSEAQGGTATADDLSVLLLVARV